MTKKASWVQIVTFCVFIALFFVLNLALPDISFSERENRELAQMPDFSFGSLFSGKYTERFESYTTDQFAFRDTWTTMKAACELSLGKKENKGVYVCGGELLTEGYKTPDAKLLDTNISAIRALSENAGVPVYFALIPGVSELRSDLLPRNAPNDSQKETIDYCYSNSGAVNVDMLGALSAHKDEYIYYRTDHHWTSLGAYYGYAALAESMGLGEIPPIDSYKRRVVSDEFYGTVYSKSGISWIRPDSIELFVPQHETTRITNYSNGEPVVTAMYNFDFLEKKDKYSMFMGGNTPLLTVTTENEDAPSLLVIRDSYFDSLTPFLQDDFSDIHIMDLRYYKTQIMNSSIKEYVEKNDIDEVLVCYSVNNFGTDTNIFLLGQ